MRKLVVFVAVAGGLIPWPADAQAGLVNVLTIPGESTDLSTVWTPYGHVGPVGANHNRLSIGSDLWYDQGEGVFYGLPDRGPNSGLLSFNTRVHKFDLDVDPATGAISNFRLLESIPFKTADGGDYFSGQDPVVRYRSTNTLGNSFDPEGLVVGPNGHFYLADEYGPSVYEFAPVRVGSITEARFVRALSTPDNMVPRDADGAVNYDPAVRAAGVQKNRGYEGLALYGNTLTAVIQDPLMQEGSRDSRNVRIVQFDLDSGESTGQFVYPLESVAEINERIPGTDYDFTDRDQGRGIGVSAIYALGDHQFLVLERDGRGDVGTDNPTGSDPLLSAVGTKRFWQIDTSGATDVSDLVLPATGELPPGVAPVSKSLLLDMQAGLEAAGLPVPDKFEGMTLLPLLDDPQQYLLLVASDNDFSVITELSPEGEVLQFDLYTDGTMGPVDGLPMGRVLLSSYLYSFTAPVPEPGIITMLLGVLGGLLTIVLWRRRARA